MTFGFNGQVERSLEEAMVDQYKETGMFAEINIHESSRPMKLEDVEKYTDSAATSTLHALFDTDRDEVSTQIASAIRQSIVNNPELDSHFENWKPSEEDITSVMMAAMMDTEEEGE